MSTNTQTQNRAIAKHAAETGLSTLDPADMPTAAQRRRWNRATAHNTDPEGAGQARRQATREQLRKAHRYIAYIRNDWKRRYAEAYLQFLVNGWQHDESVYQCSYMARQAVRLNLLNILNLDV